MLVPLEFPLPEPSAEDLEENPGSYAVGDIADPGTAFELHLLRVRSLSFVSTSISPTKLGYSYAFVANAIRLVRRIIRSAFDTSVAGVVASI